jgi:hypothetical protein
MRRLLTLTAVASSVLGLAAAAPALAHQGNPNMRSIVRTVLPKTQGVSLQILGGDDRFELTNRSAKPILLLGYDGEPYARLLPDGTVEQNTTSPAYYLNQERTGEVAVPKSASSTAPPTWKVLDRTGRFQWHDHRMHYMGTGVPPSVKDTKKTQKIFDYSIPLKIGQQTGAIKGTLMWTPQKNSGPPTGAIVAFALFVVAGAAAVVVVRRRRRDGGADDGDDTAGPDRTTAVEAW